MTDCYNKNRESLAKARDSLLNNKVPCSYCDVLRTKSNIAKHEKTCYLNPLISKKCPVCDDYIKNYKTSTTCSYSCANVYFRSGSDHGNWSESCYRTTCFHHHKKECIICQESNIVEVHHLDENRNNNDPSNLIPLCPTHHQYWHSRFKYLIDQDVHQYIKNWSG